MSRSAQLKAIRAKKESIRIIQAPRKAYTTLMNPEKAVIPTDED